MNYDATTNQAESRTLASTRAILDQKGMKCRHTIEFRIEALDHIRARSVASLKN